MTTDFFGEAIKRGMARRAAQRAAWFAAQPKRGPAVCEACGSDDLYGTTRDGECERVTCRVCLTTFTYDSVPQELRGLGDEVLA